MSDTLAWITGLGPWASAIAIGSGVYVATRQLHVWRTEEATRRRAAAAEELLLCAYQVRDAFVHFRGCLTPPAPEGTDPRDWRAQYRIELIQEHQEDFNSLRRAQIRAHHLIGDEGARLAVDRLIELRNRVFVANRFLIGERPEGLDHQNREDALAFFNAREREAAGGFGANDEVHSEMERLIDSLAHRLAPIARMDPPRTYWFSENDRV